MPNKSKGWTDVQLIISSFSIAVTLGFWGLFASRDKSGTGVTGEVTIPTQPDSVASSQASSPSPALLPGQKLIFSGTNIQSFTQSQAPTQTPPTQIIVTVKKHGGGGGGGSPHAGSGSSHP